MKYVPPELELLDLNLLSLSGDLFPTTIPVSSFNSLRAAFKGVSQALPCPFGKDHLWLCLPCTTKIQSSGDTKITP